MDALAAAGFRPFSPREFSGEQADYVTTRPLGEDGAFGLTFEAEVVGLHWTDDARPPATQLSSGLKVVIKVPRIDTESYTTHENERRLRRIEVSFHADFIASQHLVGIKSVAHILDMGTCRVDLGNMPYPAAPFSVQEYVEGERLDEYWARWAREGGEFGGIEDSSEFFDWAVKLANVIQLVHQRGVVHGDIWPKNIMIDAKDRPILIDFGQAGLRDMSLLPERDEASHPYRAREGRGRVSGDIYSLGGVLYKLATGDDPPKNELVGKEQTLSKRAVIQNLKKSNLLLYKSNRGIADVIARCMRYAEVDRARSAQDVLDDIEDFDGRIRRGRKGKVSSSSASMISSMSNELFQVMARRMVTALDHSLVDMSKGFAEITGDHQELVRGLMEYLSILKKGDTYRTLSEPRLWRPGNLGTNGRFLTMNALAAERGASVERVFLLTKNEMNNPLTLKMIQAHLDVMEEVSPGASQTAGPTGGGGYWAGYRIVKPESRALEHRKLSHFGLMTRGRSEVWVFPTYRTKNVLVTLHFAAQVARASDLLLYYEQQLKQALPLSTFPGVKRPA